jgi:hypothetical protein
MSTDTTRTVLCASRSRPTATRPATTRPRSAATLRSVIALLRSVDTLPPDLRARPGTDRHPIAWLVEASGH